MTQKVTIHWFRQDLRLADNPSLCHAAKNGTVLPVYILDDETPGQHAMGAASRWWLHHSLTALNKALGGNLAVYSGTPSRVFKALQNQFDIQKICWNRCYEPWRTARDSTLKEMLKDQGIKAESFNASLLWEPWEIKKNDGTPYKVFSQFYRNGCLKAAPPRTPLNPPKNAKYCKDPKSNGIKSLNLLPQIRWDKSLESHWKIGEDAAQARLEEFIEEGLQNYKDGRNLPAKPYVSRLSPHLHFGEISPNQAWHHVAITGENKNTDHFCSELGWREFSHSLLYYNPKLPTTNLQSKFDDFPWQQNQKLLKAWQTGQTGIPMVDAGMRELWQTGYMHNRVRMVVGSFLVKNLRLHWQNGEQWFWDTLADADLANNSASWQWVAGCGADAAPYFRIFNPVIQGQKFDPEGDYIRQFIPELAPLPNKYLFSPWQAPKSLLEELKIELGKTYPTPVVDLKKSREEALEAFKSLK